MPVSANTVQFSYTGDGVTTVFPFPSRFLSNSDILVGVNGSQIVSGFNTTGQGNPSGGQVTFGVAPANGATVTLLRAPAISQLLDFVNNQNVLAENLDNGFDKLTIIVQYLDYLLDRAIRLSEFDTTFSGNYDAQGRRMGGLAAPVDNDDAVRLQDIQNLVAAAGNVPLPTLGQVGYGLRALSAGVFGWSADAAYQPLDAKLTSESGLSPAANQFSYYTSPTAKALTGLTALGRAFLAATSVSSFVAGTDAQGSGPMSQNNDFAYVVTAPNAISGVTLPTATAGQQGRRVTVFFSPSASNLINVYPTSGQNFAGLAANAPISLRPGEMLQCIQLDTSWAYTVVSQFMRRRPVAGGLTLNDTEVPSLSWVESYLNSASLGRGQTWQVVTGSRVTNTVYQNTTGRPIQIAVEPSNNGTGRNIEVSTDNVTWVIATRSGAGDVYVQTVIVPPNHYYRFTGAFSYWTELR